jgi:hypothetical protein
MGRFRCKLVQVTSTAFFFSHNHHPRRDLYLGSTADMNTLPFDLTDVLLSSIRSRRDLRSLALTCRYWADLIIPRHIQYRKLHFGSNMELHLPVWAHLAERKDLSRNIREVRITNVEQRWEELPTTLVPPLEGEGHLGEAAEASFVQALQNFENLEDFTWKSHDCPGFMDPYKNRKMAEALSNAGQLRNVRLKSTSWWKEVTDEELWKYHPVSRSGILGCLESDKYITVLQLFEPNLPSPRWAVLGFC